MQTGTARSGENEREFLAAGDVDSTGKIRRLPVLTALPQPPISMGESTRVERLIFEVAPE